MRCSEDGRKEKGERRKEKGERRKEKKTIKNKKKKKKGGKMEFYNEYEPHGEVEQCTWQVWGQREEEQVESYK